MEKSKTQQGAIFFDGLCVACSAEINHYRKLPGSESFDFIDITDSKFDAKKHGLDPFLVHKVMHVKDSDGRLHQGVDAFRAIWQKIPRYQFLYNLSEKRWVRSLLEIGYKGFVKIRPFLPRKKADCSDSPYCETHQK
jgi:predicted DCC family thiol-disulfide oxidoreductase YuxK